MSKAKELIVLAFTDENKADEVLKTIQNMINEGKISVLNMAILAKYQDGKTKITETQEVGPTKGALFGAIMGGAIGLFGGPIGAVIGAVAGATTGGVAAQVIDSGFPNEYLQELKDHLQPGNSAVMILCTQDWSEQIIKVTVRFQAHVIRHALAEQLAAYLAALGAIDSDDTTDLPTKLEAQIAAWQTEAEQLMVQLSSEVVTTQSEIRIRIANLHAKQRRAQEKLFELLNVEIHRYTEKIDTLSAKAKLLPVTETTEIITEIETTRAQRRVVREKLYYQIERRIQWWQTEIDELNTRLVTAEKEAGLRIDKRAAAIKLFTSVFQEAQLPETNVEVRTRLAALQSLSDTARMELQNQLEAQIATWQEAISDLQAYEMISGVHDQAEVHKRIAILQEQVATAQARLKTQIQAQMAAWTVEINELQHQAAKVGAVEKAKLREQIAELQARLEILQAREATVGTEALININTRIAVLQDRINAAQTRLNNLEPHIISYSN